MGRHGSTAVRVGGLISINRTDVDRTVCIDDTAKYYLKKYMDSRTDNNLALFVSGIAPVRRLERHGVREILEAA